MRTRFGRWAWGPIPVPRLAFIIKYMLFIYFGVVSAIWGIPTFSLVAPSGYTVIWGTVMTIAGIFAAIAASFAPTEDEYSGWQTLEKWSVLVLGSLMLAYVGSLNVLAYSGESVGRKALAAGITLAIVLPLARFGYLAKHGVKPRDPETTQVEEQ